MLTRFGSSRSYHEGREVQAYRGKIQPAVIEYSGCL